MVRRSRSRPRGRSPGSALRPQAATTRAFRATSALGVGDERVHRRSDDRLGSRRRRQHVGRQVSQSRCRCADARGCTSARTKRPSIGRLGVVDFVRAHVGVRISATSRRGGVNAAVGRARGAHVGVVDFVRAHVGSRAGSRSRPRGRPDLGSCLCSDAAPGWALYSDGSVHAEGTVIVSFFSRLSSVTGRHFIGKLLAWSFSCCAITGSCGSPGSGVAQAVYVPALTWSTRAGPPKAFRVKNATGGPLDGSDGRRAW